MRIKHYPGAKVKPDTVKSFSAGDGSIEIAMLPGGISESDRWKLGGCPRCHGDVFLDSEDGELLGHCLQCGYVGARIIPREPLPDIGYGPD